MHVLACLLTSSRSPLAVGSVKLGFDVAQSTVAKYMAKGAFRLPAPPATGTGRSKCSRSTCKDHSSRRTIAQFALVSQLVWVCGRDSPAHTASFAAFTGRALTIFRAGLALNTVGSFVKGLMPARSFVAGFLMTTNFAKPGNKNAPFFFNSL